MGGVVVPPILYFNSRSRTGSDVRVAELGPPADISIHAPAQGATNIADYCELTKSISIHAPAQGATAKTDKHGQKIAL